MSFTVNVGSVRATGAGARAFESVESMTMVNGRVVSMTGAVPLGNNEDVPLAKVEKIPASTPVEVKDNGAKVFEKKEDKMASGVTNFTIEQNGDVKYDGKIVYKNKNGSSGLQIFIGGSTGAIETASGDVIVATGNVEGNVNTYSGAVTVAGDIKSYANTYSGSISAHYVEGYVNTTSGNIRRNLVRCEAKPKQ